VTRDVIPEPHGARRENFNLPAGQLDITPDELRMRLPIAGMDTTTLTLQNTGTAALNFNLLEINAPAPSPLQRQAAQKLPEPVKRPDVKTEAINAREAGVSWAADPKTPIEPLAGEAVSEFNTGLPGPWGIGFNLNANDLWVSNLGVLGGDDLNYRFLTDGTNTADTIDQPWLGVFAADMTYNSRTGMLWQVNVGGDNCLHEMDPVDMVSTGNQICAAFGTSMRGVAYNAVADTYFVGTWNNGGFIVEINSSGTILRTNNIGLFISGLAYNGSTGHVFAQVNDSAQLVWVLDANNNFAILSAISLQAVGGGPAYSAFEGAGIEMACDGTLWSVNQGTLKVHANRSDETGVCVTDIPWLSENPESGTIAAGASLDVDVTFDAGSQPPGCKEAQLIVINDTPYGDPSVPVGLTVAFNDVAEGSFGDRFIHGLAGAGVSFGCGGGNFCPADTMTRRVMALWLLRAKFGSDYNPPPATGIFADVSPESFAADFIEDLYNRGLIAGCATNPLRYCPENAVTRAQMSVFLLRTLEGSSFTPPACVAGSEIFQDVPVSNIFCPWIEELSRRGITVGCSTTPPLYCPGNPTNRAQMAIFTTRTFDIPECRQ